MASISAVVTLLALLAVTMAAPNGVSDEFPLPQNEVSKSIRLEVNLLKNETENGSEVSGEFALLHLLNLAPVKRKSSNYLNSNNFCSFNDAQKTLRCLQ